MNQLYHKTRSGKVMKHNIEYQRPNLLWHLLLWHHVVTTLRLPIWVNVHVSHKTKRVG
ncbi:hypothetical protein BLOT_006556, partial [Blomia tropicalis]